MLHKHDFEKNCVAYVETNQHKWEKEGKNTLQDWTLEWNESRYKIFLECLRKHKWVIKGQ